MKNEFVMTNTKYPKGIIVLHWLTAILFAVVFFLGITMEEYEFNEANINRYRAHALLGVAIMLLTIVRIFLKRKYKHQLPPEISYYNDLHKKFVHIVHSLIYFLLIFAPLIGFITIYQTGALTYDLGGEFPTGAEFNEGLLEVHEFAVFSLTGLIFIHIAGVVLYRINKGENLLKRMCMLL